MNFKQAIGVLKNFNPNISTHDCINLLDILGYKLIDYSSEEIDNTLLRKYLTIKDNHFEIIYTTMDHDFFDSKFIYSLEEEIEESISYL